MLTIFALLVLLLAVVACGYLNLQRYLAFPIVAIVLAIYSMWQLLPIWLLIVAWLLFSAVAVFVLYPPLRKKFISIPIFKYMQAVLPAMSETEKAALEAGDMWWDKQIFSGRPDWSELLNTPKPELSAEENQFIHNEVKHICGLINDWDIVQESDLPAEIWDYLKQKGFFGLIIPKQYAGKEFSALAHSTIVSMVASRSVSAAVTIMVPNSLGPAELLLHYGTDEQKQYYLPRLASGEDIPCFGLTGIDAGSDAGAITDRGIICKGKYNGKEVIGIKLNFAKRYITLAPVASLIGLAFKCYDPDNLLGEKTELGISLALLPADTKGIEIGKRHDPLGLAFMNGPIYGKDVFVPLDALIGNEKMIGQGWRMLMECLSVGRSISLPALATAMTQLSYRSTSAYAAIRQQFSLPIGKFEGVAEKIAAIAGNSYLVNAARVMTAGAVDQGLKPSLISAIAKYHMTEAARVTVNDAMDVHGGKAIQIGPNNYLAYAYQSLPISITVEGANILTRSLMIFGQGALRCHPYIRQEMELANAARERGTTDKFDKLLWQHIGHTWSNVCRSVIAAVSAGRIMSAPKTAGKFAYYYKQVSTMSAALAWIADLAMMRFGGALKRRECLSARLGDVLSNLYMASAVLKYVHDANASLEPGEQAVARYALEHCLAKVQIAFDDFLRNFMPGVAGFALRLLVFPYGRRFRGPSDKLAAKVAKLSLENFTLRDSTTPCVLMCEKNGDPLRDLESCLTMLAANQELIAYWQKLGKQGERKAYLDWEEQLQQMLKAEQINENQAQVLREYEVLRQKVIAVDEF